MRHLGIVITTEPERGDFARAEALATAAREDNLDVSIFLMDGAITWATHPRATVLLDLGCDITACATNLHALGIDNIQPGIVRGGQDDHAALVHNADRVVAFA